jgi:hypothetical protein
MIYPINITGPLACSQSIPPLELGASTNVTRSPELNPWLTSGERAHVVKQDRFIGKNALVGL